MGAASCPKMNKLRAPLGVTEEADRCWQSFCDLKLIS